MPNLVIFRPRALLAGVFLVTACNSEDATAQAQSGPLTCPVQQAPAKNGSAPNPELLKRIIRCHKGEKTVPANSEGAVGVEVTALQVGSPRPWSYRQDSGTGQAGTIVYPVKATYTVRTFYRAATEEEKDWIRVLNFYVDGFGEWRVGSEEPVKPGTPSRIAK